MELQRQRRLRGAKAEERTNSDDAAGLERSAVVVGDVVGMGWVTIWCCYGDLRNG